eukprot:m.15829 g.15829  ORF g.15829 m.15829 type:complete len:770 (+) comp5505_c0_seq1:20-2329(+)
MAAALALLSVTATLTSITVDVNTTSGSYNVMVDSTVWFRSAATSYTTNGMVKSTATGTLSISSTSTGSGADSLGPFKSHTISYDDGAFVTEIREYSNALVFEQRFPMGVKGTCLQPSNVMKERDNVSTSFPSMTMPSASDPERSLFQFSGDMTGDDYIYSNFSEGVRIGTGVSGFGPMCVYSSDGKNAVVISPYSEFMAASAAHSATGLSFGVQGSFTEIPAGYSMAFIMSLTQPGNVNEAFEEWGDKLLNKFGKKRDNTYNDYALKYLGYSTDNGAFYYYQTEDGVPGKRVPPTTGKTYEQTLIDVKKYADSEGIPYKYVLLDSWWYYQGVGSGVTNWVGRPDIFPDGNDGFRNKTGWFIQGHNRFWAIDNVYAAQNGGDYNFVVEVKGQGGEQEYKNFAWPSEQRFWDDLIYNSTKWGLVMYEQDWLDTEYDNVVHLNMNITAGRTWLMQMGSACERNDVTIQYCMSHCRHILQSVEIPAVTNARASGDYHPGQDQWKPLGTTGIFAHAIGIAPTKDNYWSKAGVQNGTSYHDYNTIQEPYNRLQAAVSTLSKGPVAPSDKIGASDTALIMKSCAKDGRLLQGDKAARTIQLIHNRRVQNSDSESEIWETKTKLSGMDFAVVMGATLQEDIKVSVMNDLMLTGKYVMYEANTTNNVMGGDTIEFKMCKKYDFQVYSLSPVLPNGYAFIGEQSKWVPVSRARFSDLEYGDDGSDSYVSVIALGMETEKIDVSFLAPKATTPTVVSCTIPRGSKVKVTLSSKGSSCQGL